MKSYLRMAAQGELRVANLIERKIDRRTLRRPNPDHFDPTKFDRYGNRIDRPKYRRKSRAVKFIPRGRASLIRPAEADLVLELAQKSTKEAQAFLVGRGYSRGFARTLWYRLRHGWRPKK